MRLFRKLFTFSILFFLSQAAPNNLEICRTREPVDYNNHGDISFSLLTVTQPECVRFFKLDLNYPAYSNKSLLIETIFENFTKNLDFKIALLQNTKSVPILYFNERMGIEIDAKKYDENAYIKRKTYHSIFLTKEEVEQGGISYFALYKPFKEKSYIQETLKYTIQVRASLDDFICPANCNFIYEQGICDQTLRRCVCSKGFFENDCSVKSNFLNASMSETRTIESLTWSYFSVSLIGTTAHTIKAHLILDRSGVALALKRNRQFDNLLPGFEYVCPGCEVDNDTLISITFDHLRSYPNGTLQIGIYNRGNQSVTVSGYAEYFEENNKEISNMFTIFLIITIAIGICLVSGCILSLKYARMRRQRSFRAEGAIIVQVEELTAEQQRNKFLTQKDLQNFFPKKKYSEIQSTFVQTSCSVCLDEYKEDTICHQLYCEHIFHEQCIQKWLKKHGDCPNCKAEMTIKTIKKFLRKKLKESQKAELEAKTNEEGKVGDNAGALSQENNLIQRIEEGVPREEIRSPMENSVDEDSQESIDSNHDVRGDGNN